ncbi:GNAT family N-acetyltransferase [Variovorax sp. J22R133]|uniref:GNAT family N-acetyltransferase n=1 Tax=Variovorax brevis TaxID=3053503 RepID=UPI0025786DFB|nr:GNAT family N-acetyltransferase [Variovorax sp. J22R133]MDM0116188.1 GNAT family N-acetyltransferase [Variovorax sp. J22R133]
MLIRRLTPADAFAHRQLMLEAYENHPDAFTSSTSERVALPLSWWADRLPAGDAQSSAVWGAFDDHDTLVGAAGLSVESRIKSRHKGLLFGMYVVPAARQHGVGAKLVEAVLAAARMRGDIRVVQLTVTQGNDGAQALYERCGFKTFGVEPMAVRVADRFHAKVHMWCELP